MSRYLCLVTLFIVLFAPECVTAQRMVDWMALGDKAMNESDPLGALRYYAKAMEIDSAKGELNFKYAEALRANRQYKKAAYYYYKIYRRERGRLYPESGAWLATMQKQSGDYKSAKANWRRVRDQFKNDPENYWYKKAIQEMRSSDLAMEWQKNPPPFSLTEIPSPVNTGDSEFAGYFHNDGKFTFTALRGSYNEDGKLEADIGSYLAGLYLSDSSFAFVDTMKTGFSPIHSYSRSSKGAFEAFGTIKNGLPVLIVRSIPDEAIILSMPDSPDSAWYSQPGFAEIEGRHLLFFSSNRKGGMGREDIWYIDLNDENKRIINAGELINSPGSEVTPFYRKDEQRLYFSSDWHHGFGGYDIFYSDFNGADFNFPENLQKPFNSSAEDLYYNFNLSLGKGTITSNRQGAQQDEFATCCNDLWLFEEKQVEETDTLPEIANLEDLNKYLPVQLYFHNDEPEPRTRKKETNLDYLQTYRKYIALLPEYEEAYSSGLDEESARLAEEAIDRFFIEKIDQGVQNLELFAELLEKELAEGQKIELTVKGFASPLAATDYNVNLTMRRISSLKNYLRKYKRGALIKYFDETAENGASLKIVEIPFGEYTASSVVSDNPNANDAIYSIGAAEERKIEIVSVQRQPEDTSIATIHFTSEIIDLGSVNPLDSISFEFGYSGSFNLIFDSLKYDTVLIALNFPQTINFYDSTQTSVDPTHEEVTGTFEGTISPTGLKGKQNIKILIFGNFLPKPKELNIAFEIKKEE